MHQEKVKAYQDEMLAVHKAGLDQAASIAEEEKDVRLKCQKEKKEAEQLKKDDAIVKVLQKVSKFEELDTHIDQLHELLEKTVITKEEWVPCP